MSKPQRAAQIITEENTIALTGAGLSTPSGLPDFRGENGLWQKIDPSIFHINTFRNNPQRFWDKWIDIHEEIRTGENIEPNQAHNALTDLYKKNHIGTIITQNVDGLHQESGVPHQDVVEVHGNTREAICRICGENKPLDDTVQLAKQETPPNCRCGGVLKPDSILFGEPLPEKEITRAHAAAGACDAMIITGSSLTVQPVASLPRTVLLNGGKLIIVNKDSTKYDDEADIVIHGDVTDVIPEIDKHIDES